MCMYIVQLKLGCAEFRSSIVPQAQNSKLPIMCTRRPYIVFLADLERFSCGQWVTYTKLAIVNVFTKILALMPPWSIKLIRSRYSYKAAHPTTFSRTCMDSRGEKRSRRPSCGSSAAPSSLPPSRPSSPEVLSAGPAKKKKKTFDERFETVTTSNEDVLGMYFFVYIVS